MVQPRGPLPLRDFYYGREHSWKLDIPQEGRFTAQPIHSRCMPVESALRDCAGLLFKEFALVVVDEHGRLKTYTSTSLTPYQRMIFNSVFRREFFDTVQMARGYNEGDISNEFDNEIQRKASSSGDSSSGGRSRRQFMPLRPDESDDDDVVTNGKRKRSRPTLNQKRHSDADKATVPAPRPLRLAVGDSAAIEQLYLHRFMDMQQSSCKIMAKAFVKLVEPKKQSNHPYTKGNIKAPPWWPNTEGENHVTHKEPDHLKKPERLRLLVHILRMIVEPRANQCATVQKLGLNVAKLEEVTNESMKNWFKESPDNAAKEVYLQEIFRVARAEERCKNGESDATSTYIYVKPYGDKNRINVSDDEDAGDEIKAEEEELENIAVPVTTPMSDGMISPTTMMHSRSLQSNDPSDCFRMRPAAPIRHYDEAQIDDHNLLGGGPYQNPAQQEPNRRPFLPFSEPAGVDSWPGPIASSSPFPNNYEMSSVGPYPVAQPLLQQTMLSQRLGQDTFGIPNDRYDPPPTLGNHLRAGGTHHLHHQVSQDFPHYHHGGYVQHDSEIKDEHHLHSG